MNQPSSTAKTFSKSQLTALAATVVDFSTLTFCVEKLQFYVPWAVALGAFLGAITNFFLNRHWTFDGAADGKLPAQGLRYALVSAGSLGLNTLFVWLLTEKFGVYYLYSKIATSLVVGFIYNYPMHRFFVYTHAVTASKVKGKNL